MYIYKSNYESLNLWSRTESDSTVSIDDMAGHFLITTGLVYKGHVVGNLSSQVHLIIINPLQMTREIIYISESI